MARKAWEEGGDGGEEKILGLVVYLPQEGRGIGLAAKVAAYALQEGGGIEDGGVVAGTNGAGAAPERRIDTVDANRALGLPDDAREYSAVGDILMNLGILERRIAEEIKMTPNAPIYLLSNNPRKENVLAVHLAGRVPCLVPPLGKEAAAYLKAKAQRMGHDIPESHWSPLLAPS